ncbi:MAG: hypothetical protein JSU87_12185 [Gemmatimonadota bacterium]|nr:MAG: hypothetical protein JSU87_12185 [Gemmatimonadota bacterium]
MSKRILLLFLFLGSGSSALAQEETLLRGDFESGGFGGPVVKFTEVADQFAVFAGARGGWIINHTLILGAGGYGLTNEIDLDDNPFNGRDVEFGYGGLELEYVNSSNKLAHLTLYLLIGGGGLTTNFIDGESVFVLEPLANIEVNVAKWFRLSAGGGYRLVVGVDTPGLEDRDLSALVGVLAFKFGVF